VRQIMPRVKISATQRDKVEENAGSDG